MTARIPEVSSPCIGVCFIEQRTGLCRGCFRTLAEISEWIEMTSEQKRATLELLPARKAEQGQF